MVAGGTVLSFLANNTSQDEAAAPSFAASLATLPTPPVATVAEWNCQTPMLSSSSPIARSTGHRTSISSMKPYAPPTPNAQQEKDRSDFFPRIGCSAPSRGKKGENEEEEKRKTTIKRLTAPRHLFSPP
jgi:hypothetical protein